MHDLEKQPPQGKSIEIQLDEERPVITDLPQPEKEKKPESRRPWRWLVPGGVVLLVLVIIFAGVLAARHRVPVSTGNGRPTQRPASLVSPSAPSSTSTSSALPLPSATPLAGSGATDHGLVVTLANGVAYVGTVNNAVYALRLSDGTKLWQQRIDGSVDQQPLLMNGVVYLSSLVGQYGPGYVYALRSSDGTILWRATFDGYVSLAALDSSGTMLYAAAPAGIVTLDTANGQIHWRYSVQGATWYNLSLIHNGVVYATSSTNGGSATLSALRASDGTLLWQHKQGASITVDTITNDVVYITSSQPASGGMPGNGVMALRVSDGRVLWQRPLDANMFGTVQLVDGVIYVPATKMILPPSAQSIPSLPGRTALSAFTQKIPASPALPHKEGISALYALRAGDGSVLWRYPLLEGKDSWARWLFVQDGIVYTAAVASTGDTGTRGEISALHAESGAIIWRDTLQLDPMNGLLAGSLIYITASNYPQIGAVYALHAENGALLWNYPIDGAVYSPAQLMNDVLYLGTSDGIFYALRARDGKLLWHYQTDVGS